LIREGFIDYYNTVKEQNHVKLFPNLKKGPNGYSHYFVKDFSKAKIKYITNSKLKTFHSLRANFATELENRNVKMSFISRLLGHKIGCITGDRYIKQQEIRLLRDAVEEVDYGLVMAVIPEPLPPPKTITEEIMGDFR
jgi:integrase